MREEQLGWREGKRLVSVGCCIRKARMRGSTGAVIREVNLQQSAVMGTGKAHGDCSQLPALLGEDRPDP